MGAGSVSTGSRSGQFENSAFLEHFILAVQFARDVMLLLDEAGHLIECNDAALSTYGYTRGELRGLHIRELCAPEKRSLVEQNLKRTALDDGCTFETVHQRKDGSTFPVEVSARIIEIKGHRYRQSSIRDISRRKQAEQALRREAARYKALMNTAIDGIHILDRDGNLVEANRAFLGMLGYGSEQPAGLHVRDWDPDWNQKEDSAGLAIVMQGGSRTIEKRFRHADGSIREVEINASMIEIDGARYVYCIDRDITERKAAARRIERLTLFYATLSDTNKAMLRARGEEDLFADICRIAVEHGGMFGAAVRMADEKAKILRCVAASGGLRTVVDKIVVSLEAGLPGAESASSVAFRENRVCIHNDLLSNHPSPEWQRFDQAVGVRSVAALPLRRAGKIVGVLVINHRELNYFDAEVKALLEEMASDISFILDSFERDGRRKRVEQALAESEERFRQIAENIREVFYLLDPVTHQTLYVSPMFDEIWGSSRENLYANPWFWAEAIHPDDRERVIASAKRLSTTGQADDTFRICRPDGTIRWLRARNFPIRDGSGRICRIVGTADDVTEKKTQLDKIARLTRVYAVLSGINSAIVHTRDRNTLFQEACRIAVEVGRFPFAWLGVVDWKAMEVSPAAWQGLEQELFRFIQPRLSLTKESSQGRLSKIARVVLDQTSWVSNDVNNDPSAMLRDAMSAHGIQAVAILPLLVHGKTAAVLALHAAETGFFDGEEMKLLQELAGDIAFAIEYIEKEERLNYLAYYDSLTGLANRTLFHERIEQFMRAAGSERKGFAYAILDIERFKAINDSFGREVGDELLRQVAQRLARACEAPFPPARTGADQFAILISDVRAPEEAARRIELLHSQCFKESFDLGDRHLRLSARAGVTRFPEDGRDADALFRNAEAAVKKAKASGERCVFFSQRMTERVAEKVALASKLRDALEREEFILHYQPKVSAKSGKIEGLEALIRWMSPELGLVPPGDFVPLLEETGLILGVGAWALRTAVSAHRTWTEQGLDAPRIAVNVSAIQLRQRNFVDTVREAISEGTRPPGIDLEITESLIMEDAAGTIGKLSAIRDMGLHIAIDDFGTGYSSLAYLSKLPVHSLKVDRSFVISMVHEPDALSIVSAIISLAHSMRLSVTAEGVESEEQAKFLRLLHCDQMQGYLFSRPLPYEAMTAMLRPREVPKV